MSDLGRIIDWSSVHRRLKQGAHTLDRSADDDPEKRQKLLRERAALLACRRTGEHQEPVTQVLVFSLARERYALSLTVLSGVVRGRSLGAVPGMIRPLMGLLYEREALWPVWDLRQLLGLAPCDFGDQKHSVLLMRGSGKRLALRVDEAEDIVALRPSQLRPPATGVADARNPVASGICEDGLMLLDAGAVRERCLIQQE